MAVIPCYRESLTVPMSVQFLKKKPESLDVVYEQDFRIFMDITPVSCKLCTPCSGHWLSEMMLLSAFLQFLLFVRDECFMIYTCC